MTTRRLHPTHLPISPPSPPTSHARKRPANWMTEDDDPTLHHIPALYGVPADDFNWPWYWEKVRKQQLFDAQEKEKDEKQKQFIMILGLVAMIIGLIILSFIVR